MAESRFLDLDRILAEEEELQIEAQSDIRNGDSLEYGYVTLGEEASPLPAGSRPRLPCWLGLALASARLAQVQLPAWFAEDHLLRILADPESANLRERCFYFYEFGALLASRLEGKTATLLAEIFLERAKRLLTIALVAQEQAQSGEFHYRLASAEQKMLARVCDFMGEYWLWRSGKALSEIGQSSIARMKRVKVI